MINMEKVRTLLVSPSMVGQQMDYAGRQFQRVMVSQQQLAASRGLPSVFNDPTYPDFLAVWDAGEGPHNPESYDPDAEEQQRCFPQVLWEYVKQFAEAAGLTDSYCLIWLRADEVLQEADHCRECGAEHPYNGTGFCCDACDLQYHARQKEVGDA